MFRTIKVKNTNFYYFIILLLGLFLLIYTFTRAYILSFTHDESMVYLLSLDRSITDIFNYKILPQDHMLNTLLMKVFSLLFPDTEFFLRLPNLIGHLLSLIFIFLIFKKFIHRNLLIGAFILLCFNPYLLDFYSAARGYGLSISMMLISIYFVLMYAKLDKIILLCWAFLFAILSVFSVYSTLFYFIALCGWAILYAIYQFHKSTKNSERHLIKPLSVLLVIAISLLILYLKLHEPLQDVTGKSFIFSPQGGNFYSNTIKSAIYLSTYRSYPELEFTIISIILGLFYLVTFIYLFIYFIRKRFEILKSPVFISFFITIITSFVVILLHSYMGMKYPTNRVSIFLIPLFVLTPVFLLNELYKYKIGRLISIIFIYGFAVVFIINTYSNYNFKYYNDWKYDAGTKEMLTILEEDIKNNKAKINLGINWLFEPTINFYRTTQHLDWLEKVTRKGYETGEYDYYYVLKTDTSNKLFRNKKIIIEYQYSESLLFK